MINIIINQGRENGDLLPIFVGEHKCKPKHSFGPYIRDHAIVHLVLSGKGQLTDKYGEHTVNAGELFIIRRDEETVYTADAEDPWHYAWIACVGEGEKLYAEASSVHKIPAGILRELCELISLGTTARDAYTALLYSLTHKLFTGKEPPRDRLSEIKRRIEYSYMDQISVGSLAKEFGYERSSLYRSFVSRYGIGAKEYLTDIRMTRAKDFLASGRTVQETAYLVGFRDEFGFSRAFKKYYGVPPSAYKKG